MKANACCPHCNFELPRSYCFKLKPDKPTECPRCDGLFKEAKSSKIIGFVIGIPIGLALILGVKGVISWPLAFVGVNLPVLLIYLSFPYTTPLVAAGETASNPRPPAPGNPPGARPAPPTRSRRPARLDINPWLNIWFKPRDTISRVIEAPPIISYWVLLWMIGANNIMARMSTHGLGDTIHWKDIVALALLTGPMWGMALVWLVGWLVHFTGRWLNGESDQENIRQAFVWSQVPVILILCAWVYEIIVYGQSFFTSEGPEIGEELEGLFHLLAVGGVELAIGFWALVLWFKCLGEVQSFSAWKALLNSLLAALVFIGGIVVLAMPVVGFLMLTKG